MQEIRERDCPLITQINTDNFNVRNFSLIPLVFTPFYWLGVIKWKIKININLTLIGIE